MQTLIADRIFDGEEFHMRVPVTINDGRIVALDTVKGSDEVRLQGTLVPGFIDVQVNGGGGALFNDSPNVDTLIQMFSAHAQYGATGFLPTLITDELAVMRAAANAVAYALSENISGVLGIHFEGPHLAPAKRGVHTTNYIREISDDEMELYARRDIGVRHITVAPETVPPGIITKLVDMGVIVSLGHSNANYEIVVEALAAGATGFTHLYNAMSPFQGRSPGMVGAALLDKDSWCALILDGHHVHPAAAMLATEVKPQGKMLLVTDAMSLVGTSEQDFELLGAKIAREGDKLIGPEGQLAGSMLDMASAVRNAVAMLGISAGEALRMASRYPAEYLSVADTAGSIKPGMLADLVLLDENLNVRSTWVKGTQVF